MIDQIAPGAMFGEIAMLSGEPRSASIRTATKTTLIRLKRKTLLSLMETHPQMSDTIWDVFARRRFMDLTSSSTGRFGTLSRQRRLDWFAHAQFQRLLAQEQATITEPWLFLVTGAVELQQHGTRQQDGTWSSLRAPALLQVTDPVQIIAQTPAQIVRLPKAAAQQHRPNTYD